MSYCTSVLCTNLDLQKKKNAVKVITGTNLAYRKRYVNVMIVQRWFVEVKAGDFSLRNKTGGRLQKDHRYNIVDIFQKIIHQKR